MTLVHYPHLMASPQTQQRYERVLVRADRIFAKTEFGFMVLGFAYLGLYSLEVLLDPPTEIASAISSAGLVIYAIFVADLIARFTLQIPRLGELETWITFFRENWLAILAAVAPAFRSLRVLRVLMVLRGLAPYMARRPQQIGLIVGVSFPLVLYTAALAVFEAERDAAGSNILSFGDALWWSVVSVTTVGYGDSFPVTGQGRAVAALLMFVGIGLFSSLTALIAAWVFEGARRTDNSASGQ